MRPLAIGTLSKQTGVKVPTIRYYEDVGLLPVPNRAENNRRTYGTDTVRRLWFIRHARELGFEVEAIRQLLKLANEPYQPCHQVDVIARAHLADIDGKIMRLVALRSEVQHMIDQCALGQIRQCRVIEALADHSEPPLDAPLA